jgi:hypothetical protein
MIRSFIALMSLLAAVGTPVGATVIAFPDRSAQLELELNGFYLSKDLKRPDGRSRELMFRSEDPRVNLLVELKPAMAGLDAADYRDRRREQIETTSHADAVEEVEISEDGTIAHLEYTLDGSFRGVSFSQMHFHSFFRHESWRVEIHVAIRNFQESDREWLDALRASMSIVVSGESAQPR